MSREEEASAEVLDLTDDDGREKGRCPRCCPTASELRSDSMDGAGVRFWAVGGACCAATGSAGKSIIRVKSGITFCSKRQTEVCEGTLVPNPFSQNIVKTGVKMQFSKTTSVQRLWKTPVIME